MVARGEAKPTLGGQRKGLPLLLRKSAIRGSSYVMPEWVTSRKGSCILKNSHVFGGEEK